MVKKEIFVTPILMWIIIAIGVFFAWQMTPDVIVFNRNIFTHLVFMFCFLYWVYYFSHAISVHRKAPYSISSIKKLVTTGIYSTVRHPIYSGDIVLAIGVFFLFPSLKMMVSVIWLIGVMFYWINLEEKYLMKKFKFGYVEYKNIVPKIIPKFH